jgi:hypothetical protein
LAVIIRATREKDGFPNPASSVNRVIDDLYNLFCGSGTSQGNLNSANIADSAATVTTIDGSAATTDKFNEQSITVQKLSGDAMLKLHLNNRVF